MTRTRTSGLLDDVVTNLVNQLREVRTGLRDLRHIADGLGMAHEYDELVDIESTTHTLRRLADTLNDLYGIMSEDS